MSSSKTDSAVEYQLSVTKYLKLVFKPVLLLKLFPTHPVGLMYFLRLRLVLFYCTAVPAIGSVSLKAINILLLLQCC